MAKSIFMIEHAEQEKGTVENIWQPEASLVRGAEGKIAVTARYFEDLGIRFRTIWHTDLTRSRQTAQWLGHFMVKAQPTVMLNLGFRPGWIDEWQEVYNAWRRTEPDPDKPRQLQPREMVGRFPDLCRREAKRQVQSILCLAKKLKDGECDGVVGHNPLISLAEWEILGRGRRGMLDYCQAIEFSFDVYNRFLGTEFHPSH